MALTFIDELAVKRVTNGDELESTTLRSDLVARYLFLNETLLQGLNVLKTTQGTKSGLGLRETVVGAGGEVIKDETAYLESMLSQLEEEVTALKSQKREHHTTEYDSILKSLDNKSLSDDELDKLQERWSQLSHKHVELKEMPAVVMVEKEEQNIQPAANTADMGLDLGVDLRGLEDVDVSEMLGEMVDL